MRVRYMTPMIRMLAVGIQDIEESEDDEGDRA